MFYIETYIKCTLLKHHIHPLYVLGSHVRCYSRKADIVVQALKASFKTSLSNTIKSIPWQFLVHLLCDSHWLLPIFLVVSQNLGTPEQISQSPCFHRIYIPCGDRQQINRLDHCRSSSWSAPHFCVHGKGSTDLQTLCFSLLSTSGMLCLLDTSTNGQLSFNCFTHFPTKSKSVALKSYSFMLALL